MRALLIGLSTTKGICCTGQKRPNSRQTFAPVNYTTFTGMRRAIDSDNFEIGAQSFERPQSIELGIQRSGNTQHRRGRRDEAGLIDHACAARP